MSVAYLGPPGTYTEMAALAQFGHFARFQPRAAIDEVFREVASGNAHCGLVPVENSTEGMVNHTLDCFIESPPELKICAELELPIHHAFLVHPDSDGKVQRVCAHLQALAQCRGWLDAHCRDAERVPLASNAEAALQASKDPRTAALAGELAARRYGLKVLAANIEDQADNKTRFLVIGCQDAGPSGQDKTSILMSTRNEAGRTVPRIGTLPSPRHFLKPGGKPPGPLRGLVLCLLHRLRRPSAGCCRAPGARRHRPNRLAGAVAGLLSALGALARIAPS